MPLERPFRKPSYAFENLVCSSSPQMLSVLVVISAGEKEG